MTTITRFATRAAAAAALALGTAASAAAADVEFMSWTFAEDGGTEQIQDMVDSFEAATGLDVEPQGYAWGDMSKNVFLRARSGTLPGVVQAQGRLFPSYAGIPELVDFNDAVGRERLEEMFPPNFLAMGDIDGRQLGVPWIAGTIGFVANGAVLEAAGVEGTPTTVDEFVAAMEKVRDAVPNSVPYAMATKNNNSIVLDFLIWNWTFGGEVINADGDVVVDTQATRDAIAFMAGLVEDRLAAPEIDRPDARRLFAQGEAAFYFDAPSARSFARRFSGEGEAYDVNVLPISTPVRAAGDTPVSIQWGHVLAVFADEAATAETPSVQFVMHLLENAQLVDYTTKRSVLPSTRAGLEDPAVAGDVYRNAWAAASVGARRNTIASLSNGAEVATIIGEEVQAALLGQKDAAAAAAALQSRIEDAMARAAQ